ncbi:MAG: HK97 family phage prohead protease [Lactococcus lactis]
MKLINNSARIELQVANNDENNQQNSTFSAVIAHINVVNDNGYILDGDVVKFARERYPLLYNHNSEDPQAQIGYVEPRFISEGGQYVANLVFNGNGESIKQAIIDGVYDSVSISYYVESAEWDENYNLVVKEALMNEVSVVSVGADKQAKLFANGLSDELTTEREEAKQKAQNEKKLQEIKKKYELN